MGFKFGNALAAITDENIRACLERLGSEMHSSSSTLSTLVRNNTSTSSIDAGAGLTGGGPLNSTTSISLAVGAGAGITVNANDVALSVPVLATLGGTGFTSYTVGNLLVADSTTTLSRLAIGASGTILRSNGTTPAWASLASAGIVGGTGTTNHLARWTGPAALGDSLVYDDAVNVAIIDAVSGFKAVLDTGHITTSNRTYYFNDPSVTEGGQIVTGVGFFGAAWGLGETFAVWDNGVTSGVKGSTAYIDHAFTETITVTAAAGVQAGFRATADGGAQTFEVGQLTTGVCNISSVGVGGRFSVTGNVASSLVPVLNVAGGIWSTRAPTQDAVALLGRAGGTGGFTGFITPTTLTASRTYTLPDATGTFALTANKLSVFAATTSAELAGVISNETGTGVLVFNDTPTLIAPLLGTPTSGVLTNCTDLPTTGLVNSAVTLAKMADVATSTVFYRKTAGTGAPEVNTLATLKTDLGLTGTNSGGADPTGTGVDTTVVVGTATTFLRSDGAPKINVGMVPTWTGVHTYSAQDVHNAGVSLGTSGALITATGTGIAVTSNISDGGAVTGTLIDAPNLSNAIGTGDTRATFGVKVLQLKTITFTSGGTVQIVAGNTITGHTSGATALVDDVLELTGTGTWAAGTAAGKLQISGQTGTFVAEDLDVGASLNVATVAADSVINPFYPFQTTQAGQVILGSTVKGAPSTSTSFMSIGDFPPTNTAIHGGFQLISTKSPAGRGATAGGITVCNYGGWFSSTKNEAATSNLGGIFEGGKIQQHLAGTWVNWFGGYARAFTSSGTTGHASTGTTLTRCGGIMIDTAVGAAVPASNGVTITEFMQLYIKTARSSTKPVITTTYGIKVDEQVTSGTTNYGIFLANNTPAYKAIAIRDTNAWIGSSAAATLTLGGTTVETNIGGNIEMSVAANSIVLRDAMVITMSATTTGLKIGGASDKLGFFSVTPAVRPGAFTQTYSTATHTHSNPTAVTLTDNTTGTANTTLEALTSGVVYATDVAAIRNNFADLAAAVNALVADVANAKQVLNAVIDDGQLLGLLA